MKTEKFLESNVQTLINTAVQKHQLGKLDEAEFIYRQILQIQPDCGVGTVSSGNQYNLMAITNLGIILQQQGKLDEAVQSYQQAIRLKPEAGVYNNLGIILQQRGNLEEAVESYQQAIRLKPELAEAYQNLGNVLRRQGQLEEAVQSYQQAIRLKPNAVVYNNLGNALQLQGQSEAAVESYQQSLRLNPDAGVYNNLGNVLRRQGQLEEAVQSYQQAIHLNPELAEAYQNLGIILQQQGQLEEAVQSYQQAIRLKPEAGVYNNLGNALQQQGQLEEAVQSYQQAIRLKPEAGVYNNLGNALQQQGQSETAVESYQQAIRLEPDLAQAHYNLGNALKQQGQLEAAVESYQQAIHLEPDLAEAKFGICMSQLPIIYSSFDEIKERRNQYQQHLQKLAQTYQVANQKEREKAAEAVGSSQPFYLAYQGLNDRDFQQTYGEMICQLMSSCYPQGRQPIPIPTKEANEKIRVGFVSGFFRDHSNWKIPIKGWIENLDRNKFELFGYHTESTQDQFTARATQAFVKFIQGPLPVEKWCEAIAQDKLHILIFPEIGMDPMTVKLACLRLAPIQMTSWGHPNTSGMPTIDYYLSSDLMEPEKAQEHYTEKLVRLPNLSIHYSPVEVERKLISKTDIDIQNDEIMFWCCQSLFKYLPQHDDVFPRIAQELAKCKFVFINHHLSEQVTEVFRQRLSRAFEEFGLNYQNYCIFLPRLDSSTFAGTAAIADVFLDSIAWSGCNSSLEAINYDIPIVTWPGELMRGRHSLAMLKMMGIEEMIASSKDEYVKIAVRLGQDPQYRQHISRQVAENKYKLYEDLKPIRTLEEFLKSAVEEKITQHEQIPETATSPEQVHESSGCAQTTALSNEMISKINEVNEVQEIRVGNYLFPRIPPISDSDKPRPFWSVVIPIYNRTKYLKKCLDSVLSCWTDEKDMEIIVVDDAGTVPLADLVQELGHGIVRYHRLPHNYGLPNSWNQGLMLTRGYWVHLLHDDDYVLPGFYNRLKQTLMQVPESVGAAFTGYENINETGEVTFQKKVFSNYEGIVSQDAWLSCVGESNPLQMPAVVVRRNTYERLGGFHPDLVFTSDWELWKRIATFCDWWYCPDVLAHYRQHDESKTADLSKTGAQVTSIRQAIEFSATYFPENISADITAQSRRYYFQYCLYEISLLLEKGNNPSVALYLLKEAFKIDTSSESINSLFQLLSQEVAFPLSQVIMQQFSSEKQLLAKRLADLSGDNLSKLALACGTDKEGAHHYTKHYQFHFESLRRKKLNILEIGIGGYENPRAGGESLRMWKAYFPNSQIFGIDIYDKKYHDEDRIKTFKGSQVDEEFLQKVVEEIGDIDIIIDDGSHYNHHVIKTFQILFPLMNQNGIYVIEDLQTSYWEEVDGIKWEGSKDLAASHTSMNFFKGLIDGLNYEEFTLDEYTPSYFDKHIISMHFYHNLAFIYKGLNNEGSNILGKQCYPEKERRVDMPTLSENLKLAVEHHRANRLDQAQEIYNQILEQQPNHPDALYGLGVLTQQTGQYQSAEKLLRALLRVQPKSVRGWFSLGNLRQVQGQLPEAVEAYQQALAIQPDSVAVHNNLGYTLQLQGKWEEAVTCYQKALKLQPDCTEAEVNLANALYAQGKLSPEKQAQYAGLNYNLGVARQKAGDLKTAEDYYRQAICLKPDWAQAHYHLGNALKQQGQLEAAVESYQQAIHLKSDDAVYNN